MLFGCTLSDITNFIILFSGLIGAIYVIWDKLIAPLTKIGRKNIQKKKEKKEKEIKQYMEPIAKNFSKEFEKDIKEMHSSIEDNLNLNREQSKLIAELDKKIQRSEKKMDFNEIDRIRWEILRFSRTLHEDPAYYVEDEFIHIFELHDKYIKLLKETGRINGVIDIEFEYIKNIYLSKFDKS